MSDKIKVLVVEPMTPPYVKEIEGLSEMEEVVGGHIETVYPLLYGDAVFVCHEEGKLLGLPYNRALHDEHGMPYDIIQGNFFIAGIGTEDFASLTEHQIQKFTDLYSHEMVLSVPKRETTKKKGNHAHER